MKHLKSRAYTSVARSLSASLILALVFSAFLAAPVLAADCVDGKHMITSLTQVI
ncbi:MAG: hypothetical protein KIS85_02895 [Anaerolineales bacterium]|nr:hypothetical protein [Anaerolineales bacterium]